jgi:hypothetical protein
MPDDWDRPTPSLVRDTASPGELVEKLAGLMRQRDEAQKVAAQSRGEIERLVAALRQQHPALVALLAGKGPPEIHPNATSAEVDFTRMPQNTKYD